MSTRKGYSRWALYAGATAVLLVASCWCLFAGDQNPIERWARANFSNPNLVMGVLFTSAVGWGPVTLVLSSMALRHLRRDPGLRGKWIARSAAVVGTLGTAGFVFFLVVMIWDP